MRSVTKTLLLLLVLSAAFMLADTDMVFAQGQEYTVVRGDTLIKIAKKYGITLSDLRSANGIYGDLILVDQKLVIPGGAQEPEYSEPEPPPVKEQPAKMEEKSKPPVPTPPKKVEKKPEPAPAKKVEEKPAEKPTKPSKIEPKPEKKPVMKEDKPLEPGELNFRWAFVVKPEKQYSNEVIDIAALTLNPGSKKPVITAGDKIAFYAEPGENTYVYIYLVDSRGNLELIFPTSMDETTLESEFAPGRGTYAPAKYEWFSFDDNEGTETFYLVASSDRIDKLEELTTEYYAAGDNRDDIKAMLLSEIKGMKKRVAFNSPVESPSSFGGRIRGFEIDIAKFAVDVKGQDLYSKTIRLKHE